MRKCCDICANLAERNFIVLLISGMASVVLAATVWAEPADAVTCSGSLQAKINAASPGATVKADPCVYRERVTITKPIVLQGQSGSEIRGSDIWTAWTYSGGHWKSGKAVPTLSQQKEFHCAPGTSRCGWPEQVFLDGEPLRQVASDPKGGEFSVNPDRKVVLKDDPRGRLVEVSVRRQWVVGAADNVTVRGFTMKHAANARGMGAITNNHRSGWSIESNTLSDAHAAVIRVDGRDIEIVGNDVFRGGQLGIHGDGEDVLVRGNEIHDNNTEGFDSGWEAGGAKFASGVQHLTVDNNNIFGNHGNALWLDINCRNSTISNNRVHHNARKGIIYEISSYGKIYGNEVWENGWASPEGWRGVGITVHNSSNVEVYGNTLAWNADGILVLARNREGEAHDRVHGVYVHDNAILGTNSTRKDKNHVALAWAEGPSASLFSLANNNRGANNRYWYASSENPMPRYEWGGKAYAKLASFNATRGEEKGRYMTLSEKTNLTTNNSIPSSPGP